MPMHLEYLKLMYLDPRIFFCIVLWAGALNLFTNACGDEVVWCAMCFTITILYYYC